MVEESDGDIRLPFPAAILSHDRRPLVGTTAWPHCDLSPRTPIERRAWMWASPYPIDVKMRSESAPARTAGVGARIDERLKEIGTPRPR